jgi:DUF971 family protein
LKVSEPDYKMKKTLSINDLLLTNSELAIKWSDKSESFVDLKTLRSCCPCAFCSGETDALGNVYKGPKRELGEAAYEATNYERIGHYAIRIFWGDRHADGLYTYEMLRKLGNS